MFQPGHCPHCTRLLPDDSPTQRADENSMDHAIRRMAKALAATWVLRRGGSHAERRQWDLVVDQHLPTTAAELQRTAALIRPDGWYAVAVDPKTAPLTDDDWDRLTEFRYRGRFVCHSRRSATDAFYSGGVWLYLFTNNR